MLRKLFLFAIGFIGLSGFIAKADAITTLKGKIEIQEKTFDEATLATQDWEQPK